jgi:hypothetical protein
MAVVVAKAEVVEEEEVTPLTAAEDTEMVAAESAPLLRITWELQAQHLSDVSHKAICKTQAPAARRVLRMLTPTTQLVPLEISSWLTRHRLDIDR